MIKSGTVVAGPHTRIEFERTSADTNGALGERCVHRVEMMPALAMENFFHEIVTIEAEGGMPPKSLAQAARLATLLLRHRNQLAGIPWFFQRVFFGLVVLLAPQRRIRALSVSAPAAPTESRRR